MFWAMFVGNHEQSFTKGLARPRVTKVLSLLADIRLTVVYRGVWCDFRPDFKPLFDLFITARGNSQAGDVNLRLDFSPLEMESWEAPRLEEDK